MLSALLLLALAAHAQDATLAALDGKATLRAYGYKTRAVAARAGDALIYGDRLRTAEKSRAQVTTPAGAVFLLGEEASLALSGPEKRLTADFSAGEFLIGLAKTLKGGARLIVRTPAAVASVRGTVFWGKVEADKSAVFAGFGGKISVSAQGKTVEVGPGQTVKIPFGKPPETVGPHTIPRAYMDNFKVKGGLQGVEALADPKLK